MQKPFGILRIIWCPPISYVIKTTQKKYIKLLRTRFSTIPLIFLALWSSIVLYWRLLLILSNNSYLKVKFEDGVHNYRLNALGLVYPVTDTFYNKYFHVFFIIEIVLVILWGKMMWVFDILMISVCINIEYQLKS